MDIAVGDTVWFPEAWRYFLGEDARIEYRAGGVRELIDREFHLLPNMNINDAEIIVSGGDVKRWRPPATMPAWAARIRVEIVSVRLEQVGPQRVFVYDTKEAANG